MADHRYVRLAWYDDTTTTVAPDGAKLVTNLGMRRFLIDSHNGESYGAEEIIEIRGKNGDVTVGFITDEDVINWFVNNHAECGYQCYKITEILNGYTYREVSEMNEADQATNLREVWYDAAREPLESYDLTAASE